MSRYSRYILSPQWGTQRRRALERAGFCCEFCGQEARPRTFGGGLHVHHLTYQRLGHEQPADLIVLCAGCHADVHEFPKLGADVRAFAARRYDPHNPDREPGKERRRMLEQPAPPAPDPQPPPPDGDENDHR